MPANSRALLPAAYETLTTPNGQVILGLSISIRRNRQGDSAIYSLAVILRSATELLAAADSSRLMPAGISFLRGDGETGRKNCCGARRKKFSITQQRYTIMCGHAHDGRLFYRRNFAEGITHSFVQLRKINNIGNSLPDDRPPLLMAKRHTASCSRRHGPAVPSSPARMKKRITRRYRSTKNSSGRIGTSRLGLETGLA